MLTGRDELTRLREELREERRLAQERQTELERYASDLRASAEAERARSDELRGAYVATVDALANAVEARDAYTGKHAERVAAYGLELMRRIDPDLAAEPQTEFGFILHDIGKVAIPDGILHKREPLNEDERRLMRRHPVIGWQIVRGIPFLADAAGIVLHHHERWDGGGYPEGLAGDDIPLAARVFAVADAVDAITTERPYRPAAPMAEARRAVLRAAGSQFDPGVTAALEDLSDSALESIRASIA